VQGVSPDGMLNPCDDPLTVAVFRKIAQIVPIERPGGPDDVAEGVVIDRVQLPVCVLPQGLHICPHQSVQNPPDGAKALPFPFGAGILSPNEVPAGRNMKRRRQDGNRVPRNAMMLNGSSWRTDCVPQSIDRIRVVDDASLLRFA